MPSVHVYPTSIDVGGGSLRSVGDVSGSLIPTYTNTYDLGSSAAYWKDMFISGSIRGTAGVTLSGSYLVSASITGDKIANATISGSNIANATISGGNIASATIGAENIINATITGEKIANLTITAGNIGDATITGAKVALGTIAAGNIEDLTITGGKIAVGTIEAGNIQDLTITGNKVAVGTISSDNLGSGSVTNVKVLGQAISIDKLATNISSKTLEFLYTKFKEYSVTSGTGMYMGTNVYTREILSEPLLRYRLRKLLVELATSTYPFVDIWVYASSFVSVDVASVNTNWTVVGIGSGTKNVYWNTETSAVYRNPTTTRKWLVCSEAGAGYQTWQIYVDMAATDFSAQTYLTMAFDSLASGRQLRIKFHSTVDTHYYYYDWTNPSTMTCKTVSLALADFVAYGSPNWASIVRVSIEELGTPAESLTLPIAFTTNCIGYHLETVGTSSYVEFSETMDILRPVNESLYLRFDLGVGKTTSGVTVFMEYPSSDVRGVSYLEAV